MKYIELINSFWEKHNAVLYKPSEIAFYFYLLDSCNKGRWKNPFQVTARQLLLLGMSEDTIIRCKRELKNSGLIDFKTVKGSKNTVFTLLNLPQNSATLAVGSAVSFAVGSDSTPYIEEQERRNKGTDAPTFDEVKFYFTEITQVNGEYSETFATDFVAHYKKKGWPEDWQQAMVKHWLSKDWRKVQIAELKAEKAKKNKPYF